MRDWLIVLITGIALGWLFGAYGLDEAEKPPWSKPAAPWGMRP